MGSTAAVGEQPSDGDGAKTELSPVEYEQYDHMAVHMDYYVGSQRPKKSTNSVSDNPSITISARPGT